MARRSDRRIDQQRQIIRVAAPDEAPMVRRLDDEVFPAANPWLQRAAPGELEAGTEVGDVYLLDLDGEAVAYLHVDRRPNLIYVAGIGVRPPHQGRGLGTEMIEYFLELHRLEILAGVCLPRPVVTVTSPYNLTMLRMILRRGFGGRWLLWDHFGPGRHRVGAQLRTARLEAGELRTPPQPTVAGDVLRVPVAALDVLRRSMIGGAGHVMRAVVPGPSGPLFELTPAGAGEFLSSEPPPVI